MAKNQNRKRGWRRNAAKELAETMIDGESLEIDTIIAKYFDPKTPFSYLQSKAKAYSLIQLAIKEISKMGEQAGSLGNGTWGVPTTEEQVKNMMMARYMQTVGRSTNALKTVKWAAKKNLLPGGTVSEQFLIPKITSDEKRD